MKYDPNWPYDSHYSNIFDTFHILYLSQYAILLF